MSCINSLIENARHFITLVSPYIKLDDEQKLMINDASSRGIPITVVYRSEEERASNKSLDFLRHIPTVELIACPKLHAKIYANEDYALLASRNLYTAQEGCSIEVGVVFECFEQEYEELINSAERIKRIGNTIKKAITNIDQSDNPEKGFCINCGTSIPYSPYEMPFCSNCYKHWRMTGMRSSYPGSFCHRCGKKRDNIRAGMPMDYDCWEKDQETRPQRPVFWG